MENTFDMIKGQIADTAVLLYMKGSPQQPQCGFSAQAVQALMACGVKFGYVDVLASPEVRATLPQVSNWPTFPQLFINGELVGGSDIVAELHQSGELQTMLDAVKGASAE
ncbi:Monothiol glutaredoxin [Piscirickettsia salmonis]|uniref:Grx4 family monothiol glutaredoxin n=1 Tax=Piscirickettsia salmonis TaxID=1238 RepID=UPI0012B87AD7|nr:Grx4 family monothiol glutaredoxin [Piscirickettsia salmonis]QGP49322.1 Monothiol glutaredoxin [Piscirickettsia salmonis]